MAPLDKVAFANKATRLIGGRNGATMVAAAFVAVAVAVGAGIFLADRVDKMQEELKNSQFVAALTASGEKSRITQILADPESSELFLKYVNAMAAVLTNLEQSPAEQFKQFEAILAAQEASGVKIESFLCDDPEMCIRDRCRVSQIARGTVCRGYSPSQRNRYPVLRTAAMDVR